MDHPPDITTKKHESLSFYDDAGQSGLGKTTFVNTLYNDRVISDHHESAELKEEDLYQVVPVKFISHMIEREEFGHKLAMTVVDTPGFGDSLSNEPGCHAILRYIEDQFDHVLAEESRIKRNPKFQDTRIHALLYFIAPTGHSLKELDIMLMKIVGKRVNIIPVIAKSDALTPDELGQFKKRIMDDIRKHGIPIYSFPSEADEDDLDLVSENEELRAMLPFAIVGAEADTLGRADKRRGRKYPWGFMEVDNPKHCDFAKLRAALLSSHFQDLKDITQNVLYENYRTEKLSQETDRSADSQKDAFAEPLASAKSGSARGAKDANSVRLEIEKKIRDRKDREQDVPPELPARSRSPVASQ